MARTERTVPTNITLLESHRSWLEDQPNGISGTIRDLISLAIRRDDRARLLRKIEDLEHELRQKRQL